MGILEQIKTTFKDDDSVIISKTGEEENLFYRELNGSYINLIIDDELDIEILVIPKNRVKSFQEFYWYGEYDLQNVIKRFNELGSDNYERFI